VAVTVSRANGAVYSRRVHERLRVDLTDDEVHDAIAVVGLMSYANRAALATGITEDDDL
jgi:hypothetical protein